MKGAHMEHVWVLRTEPTSGESTKMINDLGVFPTREEAIEFMKMTIFGEESDHGEEGAMLERKIRKWIKALETPMPKDPKDREKIRQKRMGIEWKGNLYVFSKVQSFL